MPSRHGTQASFVDGAWPTPARSPRTPSAACRSIRRRPGTRPSMRARPIISAAAAVGKSSSPTRRDFSRSRPTRRRPPRMDMRITQAPRHRRSPRRQGTIYTCPMHPADPARPSRKLPDLRHGARAGDAHGSDRPERGTHRHDPALLDRAGALQFLSSRSRWAPIWSICIGSCRKLCPTGSSLRWRRRSRSGRAGRSSNGPLCRSRPAISICSR